MHEKYRYNLYSPTPDYGVTPTFMVWVGRGEQKRSGFRSLYSVTEETAKAIEQEGTARQFKGVVWSEKLWLDFDSYEAAERAEERLREMGHGFIAYDTGGRGAHFGVDRVAEPSHLLPARDKAWVQANFPEADKSIYTHLHPFRIEGTKHEKTGLEKRVVCEHRGSSVSLPAPKEAEVPAINDGNGERRDKSIFDCYRVMANTVPCRNGERHPVLVKLLYALRDEAQVGINEATFWVREWNKLCEEPKTDEEIEYTIRSIYG